MSSFARDFKFLRETVFSVIPHTSKYSVTAIMLIRANMGLESAFVNVSFLVPVKTLFIKEEKVFSEFILCTEVYL